MSCFNVKMKTPSLAILFFFLSTVFWGQSPNQFLKTARNHEEKNDYLTAAQLYEKAYLINLDIATAFKCAKNYQKARYYKKAESYYKKVIYTDNSRFPKAYYNLGITQKYLGDYSKAAKNFDYFLKHFPKENKELRNRAKYQKYFCEEIFYKQFEQTDTKIQYIDNKNINSPFSDFTIEKILPNIYWIASYRPRSHTDTINFHAAIWQLKNDSIVLLDTLINAKNKHIPNFFYDETTHTLYYSVCDNNTHCSIYSAKFNNGNFTDIMRLPETINAPNSNNTQPCLATINNTQYLFFTSNRKGGKGGYDIWYSVKDSNDYSMAINIGNTINSIGNEVTPFYSENDSALFFSSDWYENYGGYDIFFSKGDLSSWDIPKNIGKPVNSSYDDVFYRINKKNTIAYLSSNRLLDKKTPQCCNNLYQIILKNENTNTTTQDSAQRIIATIQTTLESFIPLSLFFDNDCPNPRTRDTTTTIDYYSSYQDYIKRIPEYINEFSKPLKGELKSKATVAIEQFFEDSVIANYEKFDKALQMILHLLKEGTNVKLIIKGYASPLNSSDYNKNLSKRRIASVKNFLFKYQNGIFMPYLSTDDTTISHLVIEKRAFGEQKASKGVSDKLTDLRHSVYSPQAARERKVQIIGITFE